MTELPRNPNTRPPYSNVYSEVEHYVRGILFSYAEIMQGVQGSSSYAMRQVNIRLQAAEQALLRTRAVLDPSTLTDEEWARAQKTAFTVAVEMENAP